MRKIILIEDRPGRQAQFLDQKKIDRLLNTEGLDMPQESECRTWIENLNSGKTEGISSFDLVIIHRSSLIQEGLTALNSICKKNEIDLVLFSGGLSQSNYQNEGFESLSLNSQDFYSDNLLSFIDDYIGEESSSLLQLIYGNNWKLGALLQYRLLKSKYESEEDTGVQIILEDKLDSMEKSLEFDWNNLDKEIDKLIAAI